jgi:hypothetical protein
MRDGITESILEGFVVAFEVARPRIVRGSRSLGKRCLGKRFVFTRVTVGTRETSEHPRWSGRGWAGQPIYGPTTSGRPGLVGESFPGRDRRTAEPSSAGRPYPAPWPLHGSRRHRHQPRLPVTGAIWPITPPPAPSSRPPGPRRSRSSPPRRRRPHGCTSARSVGLNMPRGAVSIAPPTVAELRRAGLLHGSSPWGW